MSTSRPASGSPFVLKDGGGMSHVREFLAQNIPVCAGMLAEAQKLARTGQIGPILGPFMQRAGNLLDELDELLAAMDPIQDRALFVTITSLHRTLDSIRAAVSLGTARGARVVAGNWLAQPSLVDDTHDSPGRK